MIAFSQRDPRWATELLGTSDITIGAAGCLLTCAAGLLADAGVGTDPGRLNRWLVANGGFVDDNLFVFQSIIPFGVTLVDLIFCPRTPAPVDVLAEHLAQGHAVIAEVDFTPGGIIQPHWIRLLNVHDRIILDPWQLPGQEMTDLRNYCAPGWDVARAIMVFAIYTIAARNVGSSIPITHQHSLCIKS